MGLKIFSILIGFGFVSGLLVGLVTFLLLVSGVFGDIWHPGFFAQYWWCVPIVFFAIGTGVLFFLHRYALLHTAFWYTVLLWSVFYGLGLVTFFYFARDTHS